MSTTSARRSATRRPTQADVARVAGVSQTTVSLVLNDDASNHGRVSEAARNRVLSAIELTGYTVNPLARGLVGASTSIVGVRTYESVFPTSAGNFYFPFLEGLESEAQRAGVDLLLFTSMTSTGDDAANGSGTGRLRIADGCVLLGRHARAHDIAPLVRSGFPFAFVGRRESDSGPVPYAAADYDRATREAVERLLELGHERIALVTDYLGHESVEDRELGYRGAMAGAGHPAVMFDLEHSTASDVVAQMIHRGMTAAVATAGAAEELRDAVLARGLTIPRDLSIARLGDPEGRSDPRVEWSGFLIPRFEMGAEALRIVIRQLAGVDDDEAALQTRLPCAMVQGATTGPAPAGTRREGAA